ncbi:Uncharacterised protein [Mycobacteroides abscessus subsp. abscessus]|nr:Uncharacterised protein [Mycobacteroides abscessus subsp. abscessus]SKU43859.1 Uncharacterised protein [Mycobacteroides abscessus subsp. abscessus]
MQSLRDLRQNSLNAIQLCGADHRGQEQTHSRDPKLSGLGTDSVCGVILL